MAKKYEELTFTDDFMFCKILEQDPELCRELLEVILDRKVGRLASVNREKPVEITADGKGVRFDVFAEDDESTVYDIEMQNANNDSLPKRSRYSQGMIDLSLLERGKRYRELNRCFIIYICNFNLFPQAGRHKYTFANICREDPAIELGDETEKIFLCAEGNCNDVPERTKAFLRYISGRGAKDRFTKELEKAVEEAKLHKRWRQEYMTLLEHYERERAEGRAEGLATGKILGAVEIMRDDGKDDKTILLKLVEKYGLSESEAEHYLDDTGSE